MTRPTWSEQDREIDTEFAEVISMVEDTRRSDPVPPALDRKVKQFANTSPLQELETSWILGSGARLTLVILLFFAVAMIWLTL
jgi:hypothetical protein